MELHTIGIDLGKTVFHLVGLNLRESCGAQEVFAQATAALHSQPAGQIDWYGRLRRVTFLGRALRAQGHEVRLIPARYVKPYVKTNQSGYIDAEAIAEAIARPKRRFVPIKSDDQLDLQSLYRVRERWVMRRTAVIKHIRGLLLARGITLRKGRCHLDAALPGILEDATTKRTQYACWWRKADCAIGSGELMKAVPPRIVHARNRCAGNKPSGAYVADLGGSSSVKRTSKGSAALFSSSSTCLWRSREPGATYTEMALAEGRIPIA